METIKGAWVQLSGSETAQAGRNLVEEDSSAFSFLELTRTQRLMAFGICLGIGFALSIVGGILFVLGQVTLFALFYTIGVVTSLVAMGFLIGFKRQAQSMWDPVRRYAAILFVLSIAGVFIFAFAVPIDILVILFAIFTCLTYAWYSLSYIPYARALVSKIFTSIFG